MHVTYWSPTPGNEATLAGLPRAPGVAEGRAQDGADGGIVVGREGTGEHRQANGEWIDSWQSELMYPPRGPALATSWTVSASYLERRSEGAR